MPHYSVGVVGYVMCEGWLQHWILNHEVRMENLCDNHTTNSACSAPFLSPYVSCYPHICTLAETKKSKQLADTYYQNMSDAITAYQKQANGMNAQHEGKMG